MVPPIDVSQHCTWRLSLGPAETTLRAGECTVPMLLSRTVSQRMGRGGKVVMLLPFTVSRRALPPPEGRWYPAVGVCLGPCENPTVGAWLGPHGPRKKQFLMSPDRKDECLSVEPRRLPLPWYKFGVAGMTFLSTMYLPWYGVAEMIGHLIEPARIMYLLCPRVPVRNGRSCCAVRSKMGG